MRSASRHPTYTAHVHNNAVPSVFDWVQEPTDCIKKRAVQAKLRMCQEEPLDEPSFDPNLDVQEVGVDNNPITADEEAAAPSFEQVDRASQTTHFAKLSIEELTANPKMLQYYTNTVTSSMSCKVSVQQLTTWSTAGEHPRRCR